MEGWNIGMLGEEETGWHRFHYSILPSFLAPMNVFVLTVTCCLICATGYVSDGNLSTAE
jgi:hypothetical protein